MKIPVFNSGAEMVEEAVRQDGWILGRIVGAGLCMAVPEGYVYEIDVAPQTFYLMPRELWLKVVAGEKLDIPGRDTP